MSRRIRRCTIRLDSSGVNGELARDIFRGLPELFKLGYLKYYQAGYIHIGYYPDTGVERLLFVSRGHLRTPTLEGGLAEVIDALYKIRKEMLQKDDWDLTK